MSTGVGSVYNRGMSLRRWFHERRRVREARRLVREALRSPEVCRGTSLKPRHASRTVIIDHEDCNGRIVRVRFGILRHPRPYAFSKQSHKVIEYYAYNVESRTLERMKGLNLTRRAGRDAD